MPASWNWCRLGVLFAHNTGKALNSSDTAGTKLTYITTSNLYWDRFELDNLKEMPFTESEIEKCTVKKGDLLVCEGGDIGRSAIWSFDEEIRIQNHIHRLRSYTDLSNRFYYYVLFLWKRLERIGGQGIGLQGFSSKALHKLIVPLPPHKEQITIVEKLDSILDSVDNLDELNSEFTIDVESIKKQILDLAIRGKLVSQNPGDEPASALLERIRAEKEELIKQGKIKRDKKESVIFKGEDNSYYRNYENESVCIDENIPFEIPSNWEWCNLSMIGSTNIGLTYNPEDIIENGTMVLRSSNIVNGKIDLSDLVRVKTSIRDNQYIEENDILICARNGSKALVGKCAIFSGISERASFGAFMAVYRTAFFKYVYYFLNSNTFRSTFNSDDTKQINQLTQDMIKNSLIPLPPFEEQLRIVETIENVFAQLETIAESLN